MDRPLIYKDSEGDWRWRVLDDDDEVVAAADRGFPSVDAARADLLVAGYLRENRRVER